MQRHAEVHPDTDLHRKMTYVQQRPETWFHRLVAGYVTCKPWQAANPRVRISVQWEQQILNCERRVKCVEVSNDVKNTHLQTNRQPKRSYEWGAGVLIANLSLLNGISLILSSIVVMVEFEWVLPAEIEYHAVLSFYLACTHISRAASHCPHWWGCCRYFDDIGERLGICEIRHGSWTSAELRLAPWPHRLQSKVPAATACQAISPNAREPVAPPDIRLWKFRTWDRIGTLLHKSSPIAVHGTNHVMHPRNRQAKFNSPSSAFREDCKPCAAWNPPNTPKNPKLSSLGCRQPSKEPS